MKDEAKAELAEAKMNAVSDEAKTILDNAIASVENAADVNDIVAITSNAKSDAENADKQAMLDKVVIKVASAQTIDYRSIVTITAKADNVPNGYKLAIYLGSQKVAEGDSKSVTYEYGELKSDLNYSVKVIDANGKVQKDSNGNELSKDGGKITMKKTFFGMIIAFFRGLFKSLPKVEVKP